MKSCDQMWRGHILVAIFLAALTVSKTGSTAQLNIPDTPLFISGSKTALVQLVMQRDNKLFYEAYPSYEDINGDGVLDTTFKPDEINYYGYFDSNFCYTSPTGTHLEATRVAVNKTCINEWSGDYLNYLSMTRMDTLLRVLHGGRRLVDTIDQTILRRAFVPWENHTWGIEYNSTAIDGYNISDYSPLPQPAAGTRHLISTSNYLQDDVPYLRVRYDSTENIWQWVDKAETQGDGPADLNIILDVLVCKDGFLEDSCQQYPDDNYKPVGLLHEYGENDAMYFSLLTGSFENNLQGGVLRQTMGSFGSKEVTPENGIFTGTAGIVTTLNSIQIPNDYQDDGRTVHNDCDWFFDRKFTNGECRAWGNPIAEMMYEGMRYLSGETGPTPEFETTDTKPGAICTDENGVEELCIDESLGLLSVAWDDPYAADKPYGQCSSAYQLVISDPSPSFDGDHLPGSFFAEFTSSTLGDLHVGDLADTISENESALPGLKFIGQVGDIADGTPSPKFVDSFRNIRGQSPEAPHREGSYYAPSVAYYGHTNDLHDAEGSQSVGNFTLALGSPLPSIEVEVGDNKVVFAPLGKTVNFCGRSSDYVPTNAIVGFNVESHSPTSGSFRVSFEDMEQGADNDMDAIVRYSYSVVAGQVVMEVTSIDAAGCAKQHLGYSVSGTTQDGVYLVVRDEDTNAGADLDYELDVPPGEEIGGNWNDNAALPLVSTRTFTVSAESPAEQLPSPLWYAAKWGGFDDANGDNLPQTSEWDANGDGDPDNYFEISNPSLMAQTMRTVFNKISEETGAATAVTASTGSLNTGDRIYRSQFVSGLWTGDVISQSIDSTGAIDPVPVWNASIALADQLDAGTARQIITYNNVSKQGVPFRWPVDEYLPLSTELDLLQVSHLRRSPTTGTLDALGENRLNYLRGEEVDGFRSRTSPLGDVINSSAVLVAAPGAFYPDDWGTDAPENDEPYSDFRTDNSERRRMVYVGANDGMLHGFNAGEWDGTEWTNEDGSEVFAYVPSEVYPQLSHLTDPAYGHKYYVDATPRAADVFIDDEWRTVLIGTLGQGGQGLYALDITDPDAMTEANAADSVLWEVTDSDIARLGFMHASPVIARMANGKWVAIVGNGYNNSQVGDGNRGSGHSAMAIIDIESGDVTRLLGSAEDNCKGARLTPNAMAEPTAIDFDGDNIIDSIYAGDLYGCVYHFDVSSDDPTQWSQGEVIHRAVDDNGNRQAITSAVSVGSHPSGEGVLVYFGTGKYLEPTDQRSLKSSRLYAIWDRPNTDTADLTKIVAGNMLQQSITLEESFGFDTDGDDVDDDYIDTRTSSDEPIDWDEHEGWYMNLVYQTAMGEQILSAPVLRDGNIIVSTHIPSGDECVPGQDGWLMVLSAVNGGMVDPGLIDLDGDGRFNEPSISGIRNKVNPFSSPTVVASPYDDVIISQSETDPEPSTRSLASSFADGRLTWRELQP